MEENIPFYYAFVEYQSDLKSYYQKIIGRGGFQYIFHIESGVITGFIGFEVRPPLVICFLQYKEITKLVSKLKRKYKKFLFIMNPDITEESEETDTYLIKIDKKSRLVSIEF